MPAGYLLSLLNAALHDILNLCKINYQLSLFVALQSGIFGRDNCVNIAVEQASLRSFPNPENAGFRMRDKVFWRRSKQLAAQSSSTHMDPFQQGCRIGHCLVRGIFQEF